MCQYSPYASQQSVSKSWLLVVSMTGGLSAQPYKGFKSGRDSAALGTLHLLWLDKWFASAKMTCHVCAVSCVGINGQGQCGMKQLGCTIPENGHVVAKMTCNMRSMGCVQVSIGGGTLRHQAVCTCCRQKPRLFGF